MSSKKDEDHISEVIDKFSNLQSYKKKISQSEKGGWLDRYPQWQRLYARLITDRDRYLVDNCSGGNRVLDIGCGMGDVLLALSDSYSELHGIDPTEGFCKQSERHLREAPNKVVSIQTATAERIPYPDNYFECVVMLDVIEHIEPEYRIQSLAETVRVLVPGGEFFVPTPSIKILRFWNIVDNLLMFPQNILKREKLQIWSFVKKDHTESFISKEELTLMLREAGFSIVDFVRIGFYPAPERPGFFNSFIQKLRNFSPAIKLIEYVFSVFREANCLNQKMMIKATISDG